MKIAVALSGGVDSTAVALKLKQEGHEVLGLTMRLCPDLSDLRRAGVKVQPGLESHGCALCAAPCACVDGTRIAKELGIRHEILDFRSQFEEKVITPFVRDYTLGLTPNPCAICNREMKFGLLAEQAKELGAEKLATGHYCRLSISGGETQIRRARDLNRDQSYFLSLVPVQKFQFILLPLGEALKTDIHKEAPFHPPQAEYATSVEICFLRECDHVDFLRLRVPEAFQPGEIVDQAGTVLGEHAGLPGYTIGQRRGLGVAAPQPLYVIELDAARNRVVAGPGSSLGSKTVSLNGVNWFIDQPAADIQVQARVRYRQPLAQATIKIMGRHAARLTFADPIRAVTPGQIAAVYLEDRLIAGGRIQSSEK